MLEIPIFNIIMISNFTDKVGDNKQNCWQSWHITIHIKIIFNTLVTVFGPFYSQKGKFSKKVQL